MNYKILLVDDDPTLLRFLSEFLRNDRFDVVTAANAQTALKLSYQEHPDLAVLDVMMPGMDGWELCVRLREMSSIPIILLTAKTTETDKLRGFRLGVDDYVTKPFSFAELSARVSAILARSKNASPRGEQQTIHFCGLTLDIAKHQLSRNGDDIELTPTEYRLLESLIRKSGAAVSESELGQAVWGEYREDSPKTVRRFIWLLRQKIENDPAHPIIIKTVRGYGYRLG